MVLVVVVAAGGAGAGGAAAGGWVCFNKSDGFLHANKMRSDVLRFISSQPKKEKFKCQIRGKLKNRKLEIPKKCTWILFLPGYF